MDSSYKKGKNAARLKYKRLSDELIFLEKNINNYDNLMES
jgi:hypothetical protein